MFREFVQTNIAAVNGHGLRVGRESDDAGAIVEFYEADSDVFGECRWLAALVQFMNGDGFFAMTGDGVGEVKDFGEMIALADVLEGAGVIPGGEEVISIGMEDALADVFESVGVGPSNADGFLDESDGLLVLRREFLLGEDPANLVGHEVVGKVHRDF